MWYSKTFFIPEAKGLMVRVSPIDLFETQFHHKMHFFILLEP